jgi:hypothetical protein
LRTIRNVSFSEGRLALRTFLTANKHPSFAPLFGHSYKSGLFLRADAVSSRHIQKKMVVHPPGLHSARRRLPPFPTPKPQPLRH